MAKSMLGKSRITGKQRVARVKNIEVARRSKKVSGKGAKRSAGSGFSKESVKLQLGRRSNTKGNRATAVKELKSLVKYDKAKRTRRRAADSAGYSTRKAARKKREMKLMKSL